MDRARHRRGLLRAGLAFGTSLFVPSARACEFVTSTLRITHPWTRATSHDATTAVVCMKFDEVIRADRLILVRSPIAEGAAMAGADAQVTGAVDFLIPEGRETHLDEAGIHVRLLGLRFGLEAGRSYPLELGFEKGGVVQATLSVDYTRFR